MVKEKKTEDSELTQISVPTKKIYLEISENEKIEIILRPFKQRYFATAIAIINKYFEQFNSVRQRYMQARQGILDKYEDEITRNLALGELDAGFNEGMEIAKAILSGGGDSIGEDIRSVIEMSIYKATLVVSSDNGTERSPIEPDLEDLTWGECLVLLGSTVGLNMDFFAQNMSSMNIKELINEPSPKAKARDGEKSSPDLSAQVTTTAK